MEYINEDNLILEKEVFTRETIEKRMAEGEFNSLAKFELFLWDLEMFLQLQKILGDKIILKGGAATQFYIPIEGQRTSIDIDMICLASPDEVEQTLKQIESEFNGKEEYCKFILYEPKKPKVGLEALKTYFAAIPSVCEKKEMLYRTEGKQEVKIEFLFSDGKYTINRFKEPELFALKTNEEFNILAFSNLFADKLTTLGPNTIGIPEDRADEQFKQIYDVITLFMSNVENVLENRESIKNEYENIARVECRIHDITYDEENLFADMKTIIKKVKGIENDKTLMQMANNFQSLYLRRKVNRDKAQWAIVGFQLDMLVEYIFNEDVRLLAFKEVKELIDYLDFRGINGLERAGKIRTIRVSLEKKYSGINELTEGLFRKQMDRIIWELSTYVPLQEIKEAIEQSDSSNLQTPPMSNTLEC